MYQKADAVGRMGISSKAKVTLAIMILANGAVSDQYDELLEKSLVTRCRSDSAMQFMRNMDLSIWKDID